MQPRPPTPSIFEQACSVYDGWDDPETRLRVLHITARNVRTPGPWHTLYHQLHCFLDGGRTVLLRTGTRYSGPGGTSHHLVDLTTGEATTAAPQPWDVTEVHDATRLAQVVDRRTDETIFGLWHIDRQELVASCSKPGWRVSGFHGLPDGRRALLSYFRDKPSDGRVSSRMYLLEPGAPARLIMEAEGCDCNHMQGCPTDADLYSYDRWPSPQCPTDMVIHLRTIDGSIDKPIPMLTDTMRPGRVWGVQRDHYVWTPDGTRIASYLSPDDEPRDDHYHYQWWLSVIDPHTGEDVAARYPTGRWGCHFQVTPDSRYIVSGGAREFQYLYAVDVAALADGWNERPLCKYPPTEYGGTNSEPFHFPFVLPDGSGVVFSAGWPGPRHGVYLCEWPRDLC